MNCEVAQRTIALAALAPAQSRHVAEFAAPEPGTGFSFPAAQPGIGLPASGTACQTQRHESSEIEEDDRELVADGDLAALEAELFAAHPELAAFAGEPRDACPGDGFRRDFPEVDLPEDERLALEEHLAGCRECQAEMAATAAFYRALSLTRQPEPTPSLVARARLRLDATLDQNAHQSMVAHLLQQLSFSAGRLRASPGLASGLLLLGLAAGGYGGFRAGHAVHNAEQHAWVLAPETEHAQGIADIISIARDPNSENVEVRFDRLVPETLRGSLDDVAIRRLLVLGTQNGVDRTVRNDSVDLIAGECRHGHQCNGGPVRTTLLNVLRKDREPRVRIEALDGLEPYIAEDMQVRDAVVRALMADTSANVRIEAIRLLTPVEVDSSVRRALHTVAAEDRDPSIRNASQQMLNGMPQVQ